ncbi:hypothetical protein ACFQ0B_42365 [Nonomuraea thailandensis]
MVHSPIGRPARMALVALLAAAVTALPAPGSAATVQPGWRDLAAAQAPDANPLEGFIPYAGAYTTFPHSMEWFYLPLNAVMTGPHRFDWGRWRSSWTRSPPGATMRRSASTWTIRASPAASRSSCSIRVC